MGGDTLYKNEEYKKIILYLLICIFEHYRLNELNNMQRNTISKCIQIVSSNDINRDTFIKIDKMLYNTELI